MFGSPETTTGGNALKFYASQRLDIRRIGAIKENSKDKKGEMVVVGNRTRVKVVKNKMAPPFREAEFDILYGKGISRSGEVVDMAVDLNFIQKSGAWYSVGSERIGQGRDNARTYLEEHPETMAKLEAQLLAHYEIGKPDVLGKIEGSKIEGSKTEGGKDSKEGKDAKGAESASARATASGTSVNAGARDDDDDDDDDDVVSGKAKAVKVANGGTSRAAAVATPAKRPGVRAN
jgi:recombination protein RecA